MLQVLNELPLFLQGEVYEFGFQDIESRLAGFVGLTFKNGRRNGLYFGEGPLLFDRFYVILIIFLKSSPVLFHKLLLEADLVLWSQFFLGKGLKLSLGKLLMAI